MAKIESACADPFGLRRDEGWVDAFLADFELSAARERELLASLIDVAVCVQPGSGASWEETYSSISQVCFTDTAVPRARPDGSYFTIEPAKAGSDEFSDSLKSALPAAVWFNEVETILAQIDRSRFSEQLSEWLSRTTDSRTGLLNRRGRTRDALHGLMWLALVAVKHSAKPLHALREMTLAAMEKRTWPATPGACILALMENVDALGALSLLTERAKRPVARMRYSRLASHLSARLGITLGAAAELFVPDAGFDSSGSLTIDCEGFQLSWRVDGIRIVQSIRRADGSVAKALPAAVKKRSATNVSRATRAAKDAQRILLAQRDRIEAHFLSDFNWTLPDFNRRYLQPPLVCPIARRLLWRVGDVSAIHHEGAWLDIDSNTLTTSDTTQVRPWHPMNSPVDTTLRWRSRLFDLGISQPFKQAFREVYILTDAERQTETYSNRFAAHVLRQQQFRALCTARQWSVGFAGGWDSCESIKAVRTLPGGWRVEFWVAGVGDEFAPNGGYLHVATDQVRFYRPTFQEPSNLAGIPPLLFSEILRDVDLFVGVASVGNDPTWQDGGPGGRYQTYWQNYSFGDLSETAQTRKSVLQTLLPRLSKIRDRCRLDEKFLVVRGDIRTYKIHLGSGNILMEPNDQYLCIVPDRSSAKNQQGVFLPFEGDATLSIILSKAFLLAADAKITDPTITRQIGER